MSNKGTVVQIIGPVIDIEFGDDQLPKIFNAVRIQDDGAETGVKLDIVAEVAQHLGEGRVRAVSMVPRAMSGGLESETLRMETARSG